MTIEAEQDRNDAGNQEHERTPNVLDYPAAPDEAIARLDPAGVHPGVIAAISHEDDTPNLERMVERTAWVVWYLRFADDAEELGAEAHMLLPVNAVAALRNGEVEDKIADFALESARERMKDLAETMDFIDEATEEIRRLTSGGNYAQAKSPGKEPASR